MDAISVNRRSILARIAIFGKNPTEKELQRFSTCDFLGGLLFAPYRAFCYMLIFLICAISFLIMNLCAVCFTASYFPLKGFFRQSGTLSEDEFFSAVKIPFLSFRDKKIRPIYFLLAGGVIYVFIYLDGVFPKAGLLTWENFRNSLLVGLVAMLFIGVLVLLVRGAQRLGAWVLPRLGALISALYFSVKEKTCKPIRFVE